VVIDGYLFFPLLIDLLLECGAIEHEGSIIDPGGPGMTSAVSLTFAANPKEVVDKALNSLKTKLSIEG
jgi:hypothetical protein